MSSSSGHRPRLDEPLKLDVSGVRVHNRLMKAALTERLASWDRSARDSCGVPTQELVNLYRSWGASSYGIVITGNIIVDTMNIEAPGNMIIPPRAPTTGPRFERFGALASAAKQGKGLLLGQISHAGRQAKAHVQPSPISASAIPLGDNTLRVQTNPPKAASRQEIATFVENFAHSAHYLEKAGFDGVQLHAAHGYLLSQFLSKASNERTDEYGPQTMENRARIVSEIAAEIKKRTSPSFVLAIKINSVEFEHGGFQPEDAAELGMILDKAGFDVVELSGGTYKAMAMIHKKESTRKREAFFIEFAEQIMRLWKSRRCKVYVTGGFQSAAAMLDALQTVDGIGLGRAATQQLDLVSRLLNGHVAAVARSPVPSDNYGATAAISGTQLRQIAEERAPLDMTQSGVVQAYFADSKAWFQALQKDTDMRLFKWMQFSTPGTKPARHWSDDLQDQGKL